MTGTLNFNHVTCGKTRAYLMADESTTLDFAGDMIDAAAKALLNDEASGIVEDAALTARHEAIDAAEHELGMRNSTGVRGALRDFWSR